MEQATELRVSAKYKKNKAVTLEGALPLALAEIEHLLRVLPCELVKGPGGV